MNLLKKHSDFSNPPKILLLGANGMLGCYFNVLLSNYGFDVTALGKDGCDVCSSEECSKVIEREVRPDIIINTAAFTNVDLCESKQKDAFRVNAEAAKNLALSCKAIGARLIHFSTDYVFSGKKKGPYLETDKPDPINIYGKSKLEGERYIQEIMSENYLIVRIAGLFGHYGVSFVQKIKKQFSKNQRITVVDDQTVSPTYCKDVAEAVIGLLDKETPPILNITNQGVCSWYQFAQEVANLCPEGQSVEISPIKTNRLNLPATRPANSALSGELFKQITGKSIRHWRDALKYFLDHSVDANMDIP